MSDRSNTGICTGCDRAMDGMHYAGGYYVCRSCWYDLIHPSKWSQEKFPPEIARKVLDAFVIHRCESEMKWDALRSRTYGKALTEGVATFYPVAWILFFIWVAYEGIMDGKPMATGGIWFAGFWMGFAAAYWMRRRMAE